MKKPVRFTTFSAIIPRRSSTLHNLLSKEEKRAVRSTLKCFRWLTRLISGLTVDSMGEMMKFWLLPTDALSVYFVEIWQRKLLYIRHTVKQTVWTSWCSGPCPRRCSRCSFLEGGTGWGWSQLGRAPHSESSRVSFFHASVEKQKYRFESHHFWVWLHRHLFSLSKSLVNRGVIMGASSSQHTAQSLYICIPFIFRQSVLYSLPYTKLCKSPTGQMMDVG